MDGGTRMQLSEASNPYNRQAVIAACRSVRQVIQKAREQALNELYEKNRYYRKYWFFGPRLERTREEALAIADPYEKDRAKTRCERQYEITSIILGAALASSAPSFFHLTPSQFDWIEGDYQDPDSPAPQA